MGFYLLYPFDQLSEKLLTHLNLMSRYNPGSCQTKVIIPPDGGSLAWFNVGLTFLQNFYLHPIILLFFAYVDFKTYGVFGGIFIALRDLTVPLGSALCNCYGFRTVSLLGSLTIYVSLILCFFFGQGFISSIFFSFGVGFGCGLIHSCAIVLPKYWFSRKRVIANAISQFGMPVGNFITAIIVLYTSNNEGPIYPIEYAFLFLGGFSIILFVMSIFMNDLKGSDIKILKTKNLNKSVTFHDLAEARFLASNLHLIKENKSFKWFNVHNNIKYPSVQDIVGLRKVEVNISSFHQIHCTDFPMRNAKNPICDLKITIDLKQDVHFGARPYYRTDIFFEGNIGKLAKYRTQDTQFDYHMMATRAMTEMDLKQELNHEFRKEAFFRVIVTMCDFSVLKCRSTVLVIMSLCASTFGFYTPYFLLNERAREMEFSFRHSFSLYFFFGFGTLFGKLIGSMLIIFLNMFTEEIIYANILFVAGVASIISNFTTTFYFHICYSILLGVIYGLNSLRAIILFNTSGLDNLTNVFGIYCLLNGASAFLGIIFAVGLMFFTGSIVWIYTIFGSILILSALLLYPAHCIKTLVRDKYILSV